MITSFIKQKQDSLLNIVRGNVRLTIVITWEDDSIITIYEKDKNHEEKIIKIQNGYTNYYKKPFIIKSIKIKNFTNPSPIKIKLFMGDKTILI